MRKYLWLLALLVFVPRAKADTFLVTSGSLGPGQPLSLSGDGFTLNGFVDLETCPQFFRDGLHAIQECGFVYVIGGATLILNGVSHGVGFDTSTDFGGDTHHIVLSGVTQATLTQPAEFLALDGCLAAFVPCAPSQQVIFTLAPGAVIELNLSLAYDSDPFFHGYAVTKEIYTITTPEPGTGFLLVAGVGLFGLMMRKRIAQGLA